MYTQTHTFRPRRFSTQIDGNCGRGIYIYHFIGYKNLFEFYSRIEIKSTSPGQPGPLKLSGYFICEIHSWTYFIVWWFFSALCPSDFICLTHRKVTNTGKYRREKNILYAENAYVIVYLYMHVWKMVTVYMPQMVTRNDRQITWMDRELFPVNNRLGM